MMYELLLLQEDKVLEMVHTDDRQYAINSIMKWTEDLDSFEDNLNSMMFYSEDEIFMAYVMEYLERIGMIEMGLDDYE